jgi:hypothetical protein
VRTIDGIDQTAMSEAEPQPAKRTPRRNRLQFSLRTLLLLFVLLASSMGAFGAWGIANCALVVTLAVFLRKAESLSSLAYPASIVLCLMCLLGPLSTLRSSSEAARQSLPGDNPHDIAPALQSCLTLPNIAAAAVWLFLAGFVLAWAVRTRKPAIALSDLRRDSSSNGRALAGNAYRGLLVVHGLLCLVMLALLAYVLFGESSICRVLERLDEKGELPWTMSLVVRLSPYLLRLLPLALTEDAAVLYVLGRLPRSQRWLSAMWFSLVAIGLFSVDVLIPLGLLIFSLRGSYAV